MRLGILTGGGDCPGLNAVIRAVVRTAEGVYGDTVIGYRHGWHGVTNGLSMELTGASTHAILVAGGTMLGTSRYHPSEHDGATEHVLDTLKRDRIAALLVVGGDGTLAQARVLAERGVRVVGIPKTIDNDVQGTDRSVGFDTALWIATEAVDRVHTTAESHDRVMVVEVMGHRTGWLAVGAGIAGGAHVILAPEKPFDIEEIAAALRHRHQRESFSIVVVAEGAVPIPGTLDYTPVEGPMGSIVAGAIGERVRSELAARTDFETRLVVLGHVQRGGPPTPADRLLGTQLGVAAVDAVHDDASGMVTAINGYDIRLISLAEATASIRTVPEALLKVAAALAG
ncbi:MAG TPA: ATP-dependent 6-phosphofructokinase [Solirubrobacteraceae bacterium]|nr:ATP-dependent 6-phosphofructokinase [Solirubrobacteraceae bacterium]